MTLGPQRYLRATVAMCYFGPDTRTTLLLVLLEAESPSSSIASPVLAPPALLPAPLPAPLPTPSAPLPAPHGVCAVGRGSRVLHHVWSVLLLWSASGWCTRARVSWEEAAGYGSLLVAPQATFRRLLHAKRLFLGKIIN